MIEKRSIKKEELLNAADKAIAQLWTSGVIDRAQEAVRSTGNSDDVKKAWRIGGIMQELPRRIKAAIEASVRLSDIRFKQELYDLCTDVTEIIEDTKRQLDEVNGASILSLKEAINAAFAEATGEVKDGVNLKEAPRGYRECRTSFERDSLAEDTEVFGRFLEKKLSIFIFNNGLIPYIRKLREEGHLPANEMISEQKYKPIQKLGILYMNVVEQAVDEARKAIIRGGGKRKLEFGRFLEIVRAKLDSVIETCRTHKDFFDPDYEKFREPVRQIAITAATEARELFDVLEEAEFYQLTPDNLSDLPELAWTGGFKGFDNGVDYLFLPKKTTFVLTREGKWGGVLAVQPDRGPTVVNSISRAFSTEERNLITPLWRSARTNVDDMLNAAACARIVRTVNNALHGGLNLLSTKDMREALAVLSAEEKAAQAAEPDQDLEALKSFYERLITNAKNRYVSEVSDAFVRTVRCGFEQMQRVESGSPISVSADDFGIVMQALSDVEKIVEEMFSVTKNYYGNTEAICNSFSTAGRKRYDDDGDKMIDKLWKKYADKLPGLNDESKPVVKAVRVDADYVLTNFPDHESPELESVNYDLRKNALAILMGDLFSSGEVYDGDLLPSERQFLETCLRVCPLTKDADITSVLRNIEGQGLIGTWTTQLNQNIHCGENVRTPAKVKELLQFLLGEILCDIATPRNIEEKTTLPEALKHRIDTINEWVGTLKGGRLFRQFLEALARMFKPEIIENVPLAVTESVVEKLELCRSKSIVTGGGLLKFSLTDADLDALATPVLPMIAASHRSVDRIAFRLGDIDRRMLAIELLIERKKEALAKAQALVPELERTQEQVAVVDKMDADPDERRKKAFAAAKTTLQLRRVELDLERIAAEEASTGIEELQAELERLQRVKDEITDALEDLYRTSFRP